MPKRLPLSLLTGGAIGDYEGWNKVTKPPVPQIAINTTAGSGAEISMSAVISDESRKVKMIISSPLMTPLLSVNDPLFMTTMPQDVTASSGIDVITHAVEAYVSIEASPLTDAQALGALELAVEFLPRAYVNGNDMDAREKMMFANIMAGFAFNNAGLGLLHAMSHQVGGFYNAVHGSVNAILLPQVLEFNAPAIPEHRIVSICQAMHLKAASKAQGIDLIAQYLTDLNHELGIPSHLGELGLESGDIEELSRNALKDITSLTNPRKATREDVVNLYKALL